MNFHPPFSDPRSFFFFSYPSNSEIIFDFSDIITKIHPPFQNPGSALEVRVGEGTARRYWLRTIKLLCNPRVNIHSYSFIMNTEIDNL